MCRRPPTSPPIHARNPDVARPILLRLTVMALSLAVALSLVTPAGALVYAPEFVEQQAYLTCTEPTRVTNLNRYYYEADNPSWSTTPPTGTFAAGDGCTGIDTVVYDPPPQGGSFNLAAQGGFVGNLDTIVFDLYAVQPAEEFAAGSFWLDVVGEYAGDGGAAVRHRSSRL